MQKLCLPWLFRALLREQRRFGSWLLSKPRQEALLKRLCSFLMTESQRPKLCCARARTPSGRPIVRHKDGLVLHAAARRRRRDTAASHCHRARVCEYGPKHRPRRRKSLVVRGKGNCTIQASPLANQLHAIRRLVAAVSPAVRARARSTQRQGRRARVAGAHVARRQWWRARQWR